MEHDNVKSLLESGMSWTAIFRAVLEEVRPEERSRMVLFRELQCHFEVGIETLSMIGGWDYWSGGGYDDIALDARLQGKLVLRGNAITPPPTPGRG